MDKNPDWNFFWKNTRFLPLATKLHQFRVFAVYKRILDSIDIKNPDVIELGCGTGGLTAKIIKEYGGTATLVDNSDYALKIASSIFKRHRLSFNIIKADLLKFKPPQKFDIAHSEGLIEHFSGKEQKKIIELHKNCINENGFVLISTPRKTWYYSISRKMLEVLGKWPFGDEKPMDAKKLKNILEQNGLTVRQCFNSGRYAYVLATL